MPATGWCLWCYKSVFGETQDNLLQMCVPKTQSLYNGLCMHKEVIIVDICKSSFGYIKIFFFLFKALVFFISPSIGSLLQFINKPFYILNKQCYLNLHVTRVPKALSVTWVSETLHWHPCQKGSYVHINKNK